MHGAATSESPDGAVPTVSLLSTLMDGGHAAA